MSQPVKNCGKRRETRQAGDWERRFIYEKTEAQKKSSKQPTSWSLINGYDQILYKNLHNRKRKKSINIPNPP